MLSAHNSQHLFDPYSFTHILHGFLFCGILGGLLGKRHEELHGSLAVVIEGLWELLENSPIIIERYRSVTFTFGYQGDSIVNSLGDILCCFTGFLIARRLGLKRGVVFFLLSELMLLLWIKDSLLLNILMLVHPIEAVKAWQLAG